MKPRHVEPPTGDGPPQQPSWHRLQVRAAAVLQRPRAVVWAELEDRTHPAWSDGEPDDWALVEGSPAHGLGTRRVSPFQVGPPYGILTTLCSVVTEFTEGWRYTTVTFAGSWEHTETLYLSEGENDATHVDIHGWFSCLATPAGAQLQQRRLTYLAQGFLDRAQRWQPGEPPRPVVVPRDL